MNATSSFHEVVFQFELGISPLLNTAKTSPSILAATITRTRDTASREVN
jgi:hypothetical protein